MKIAFKTLGCKANRAESDVLLERLSAIGHTIVDAKARPDIYIINTCSVTNDADKKSRQVIRALAHARPRAKIFVFGCGVRAHKGFYKKMKEVEFSASEPSEILEKFGDGGDKAGRGRPVLSAYADSAVAENLANRTRAIIKIQDGCNNFCSYCIIRILRGREKSYPMKEILCRVNQKIAEGYKEIVLTGINITSWRGGDGGDKRASWRGGDGGDKRGTEKPARDEGKERRRRGAKQGRKCNFVDLIRTILEKTSVQRLRISSMEPECVDGKFARLLKNPRLCPHIHLPLQSGSDKILRLMQRKYDTKKFAVACRLIKSFAPDAAITTDMIVGFPGETEKDFQETVRFCKKIGFAKIHVFPYSERKNTPASMMSGQIDSVTKNQRAKILRDLSDNLRARFIKKRLGRIYEVLFEGRNSDVADSLCLNGARSGKNIWRGLTPNYIKVNVASKIPLKNVVKKIGFIKVLPNNETIGEIR